MNLVANLTNQLDLREISNFKVRSGYNRTVGTFNRELWKNSTFWDFS